MKILIINDFFYSSKKQKNYPFLEIFEYLWDKGYKIELFTIKMIKNEYNDWNFTNIVSFLKPQIYKYALKKPIKRVELILSIIKGYFFYLFKKLLKEKNNKIIVYAYSGLIPVFFTTILCKLFRINCIIGPNSIPSKNLIFKKYFTLQNLKYYIRDIIISHLPCSKIISFSKYHKLILSMKYKINPNKISIVGIGVNKKQFRYLKDLKLKSKLFNNENYTISYIGRPNIEKGFDIFIKACKDLIKRNLKFNIIIAGIIKQEIIDSLYKKFSKLNANIKIYKWIPRNKLIYLYNASDLYINPSFDETWSMTTVESLMCGTPCICSNHPVFKEHIIERFNGLLFKIKNKDDLVEKILEGYKIKWNKEKIHQYAIKKYNISYYANKLIQIHENILNL